MVRRTAREPTGCAGIDNGVRPANRLLRYTRAPRGRDVTISVPRCPRGRDRRAAGSSLDAATGGQDEAPLAIDGRVPVVPAGSASCCTGVLTDLSSGPAVCSTTALTDVGIGFLSRVVTNAPTPTPSAKIASRGLQRNTSRRARWLLRHLAHCPPNTLTTDADVDADIAQSRRPRATTASARIRGHRRGRGIRGVLAGARTSGVSSDSD